MIQVWLSDGKTQIESGKRGSMVEAIGQTAESRQLQGTSSFRPTGNSNGETWDCLLFCKTWYGAVGQGASAGHVEAFLLPLSYQPFDMLSIE